MRPAATISRTLGRITAAPSMRPLRRTVCLTAVAAVGLAGLGATSAQAYPEFHPEISMSSPSRSADSPTGLDVDLYLPQNNDPEGQATANLKDAEVALPAGMSLSPSAANTIKACSDEGMGLVTEEPELRTKSGVPVCPKESVIGTVGIDTALLDHPNGPGTPNLMGNIYLGQQKSDDPASGSMFRIWLVASGSGVQIKLLGRLKVDPVTGQATTNFTKSPQLPFTHLFLHFDGGTDAPLATPPVCGDVTASAKLVPYTSPFQPAEFRSAAFGFDQPAGGQTSCPTDRAQRPFVPGLAVGSTNPTAGTASPLELAFVRNDGDQELSGLRMHLPTGMLANLRDVPLCPEAQAAAGTCDASTRVGSATAGSGPGARPFFLSGQPVYLTGPYKGAPYGLAVVIRAIAGPFDLGSVVVRQTLNVNPNDASVDIVSDPFPQILKGVPLRLRRVSVSIDRPNFTNTPTSCVPKIIDTELVSIHGAKTPNRSPYQVQGCDRLGFAPNLGIDLTGKGETGKFKHPGLVANLGMGGGQANLDRVTVKLPLSLALDVKNAQGLCTYQQGLAVACPESSIVGKASVVSPLLKGPLSGPVYFVENVRFSSTGRPIPTLPSLLVTLRGEVALNLRAHTEVVKERLVTTFDSIPDAAVSAFNLEIFGGKHGILKTNTTLCGKPQETALAMVGQNGKRVDRDIRMSTICKTVSLVKVKKASYRKGKVTVSGTLAKTATKPVSLAVRCGKRVLRKSPKAKNGAWKTTLTCKQPKGRKTKIVTKVVAKYTGDATHERSESTRRVTGVKLVGVSKSKSTTTSKSTGSKKGSASKRS